MSEPTKWRVDSVDDVIQVKLPDVGRELRIVNDGQFFWVTDAGAEVAMRLSDMIPAETVHAKDVEENPEFRAIWEAQQAARRAYPNCTADDPPCGECTDGHA